MEAPTTSKQKCLYNGVMMTFRGTGVMALSQTLSHKLKGDAVVPYFKLPSSQDVDIDTWQYKQRNNLVIVFYHGSKCVFCQRKLEEYARIYEKVKEFQYLAEILAISFDSISEIKEYLRRVSILFPLLSDDKEEATEKYTYKDDTRKSPFPSIFITDRYGALHYQKIAREASDLPDGDEILGWLLGINVGCPECSHL